MRAEAFLGAARVSSSAAAMKFQRFVECSDFSGAHIKKGGISSFHRSPESDPVALNTSSIDYDIVSACARLLPEPAADPADAQGPRALDVLIL